MSEPTVRRLRFVGSALIVLCLAAALAPAAWAGQRGAPPPTTPPPPGTGAISGVVLDGSTDRPLAGVLVYLGAQGRGAVGRVSRQVTDALGRFVFTHLPPASTYFLIASKLGYFDGRYGADGPAQQSSRTITLTDGQWMNTARVVMWRTGVIAGTVLDDAGEPVVGAYVRAVRQVVVGGHPQLSVGVTTRTDDRGMYRLAGIDAGRYLVQVPSVQMSIPAGAYDADLARVSATAKPVVEAMARAVSGLSVVAADADPSTVTVAAGYPLPPAQHGRQYVYPPTFHPAARSMADAATIDLVLGEQRSGVNVTLRATPAVRVSGDVQGPPDALVDLTLRLVPEGSEAFGNGSEAATSLVGRDGRFSFAGVPSGAYTLEARRSVAWYSSAASSLYSLPTVPGRFGGSGLMAVASATSGTSVSFLTSRLGDTHYARQRIDVGDRDLNAVVVALQPTAELSGRIVFETPPADARILQVIQVMLEPAGGDLFLGLPRGGIVETPRGYEFTISGLQPGLYVLNGGSLPSTLKSVTWNGRDYTYRPFDATSGESIRDVVVTVGAKPAVLAGQVHDTQGQPAVGASVIYFPVDRDGWTNYGYQPLRLRSITTSSDGTYRVGAVAGEFFVLAVPADRADGWKDPKFLEAASRVASRVTLDWGASATLDLTVQVVK